MDYFFKPRVHFPMDCGRIGTTPGSFAEAIDVLCKSNVTNPYVTCSTGVRFSKAIFLMPFRQTPPKSDPMR
jgi:hypothetical protein